MARACRAAGLAAILGLAPALLSTAVGQQPALHPVAQRVTEAGLAAYRWAGASWAPAGGAPDPAANCVRLTGVTPAYAPVRSRGVAAGRFIDESDERTFARVCVLGHRLARRLFGTEGPVGQSVTIAGREFRVVGVGEKLGNQFVRDSEFIEEMEGAFVPLVTLRKFYTGEEQPSRA